MFRKLTVRGRWEPVYNDYWSVDDWQIDAPTIGVVEFAAVGDQHFSPGDLLERRFSSTRRVVLDDDRKFACTHTRARHRHGHVFQVRLHAAPGCATRRPKGVVACQWRLSLPGVNVGGNVPRFGCGQRIFKSVVCVRSSVKIKMRISGSVVLILNEIFHDIYILSLLRFYIEIIEFQFVILLGVIQVEVVTITLTIFEMWKWRSSGLRS